MIIGFPLKPDAQEGIKPALQSLLKAGVIRETYDSPVNTPLFPVKKAPLSNGWRMVQDLQAVNAAVIHSSRSIYRPDGKFFSVTDISNAFFSIPVHPDSQFWFAFTFQGKQYTWTRLPQGYCESSTIFSQVMSSCMSKFNPPKDSQILL